MAVRAMQRCWEKSHLLHLRQSLREASAFEESERGGAQSQEGGDRDRVNILGIVVVSGGLCNRNSVRKNQSPNL